MSVEVQDYVKITLEHKFADLTGIQGRGQAWDADVWRSGRVNRLGEALIQAGQAIAERAKNLPYVGDKGTVEAPSNQLLLFADHIVDNGKELAARPENECFANDGTILIIDAFVGMTVALLNYAEEQAKGK